MNKVLIAVPTMEMARQALFYDYFNCLVKPIGTIMTFAHGQSPAKNRNLMIQQALDNECSHVLFIDDDTAFEPDMLERLISHDKPIVTGLYFMRNFPHNPIIFDEAYEDGRCRTHFLSAGETGLIPIVAAGLGCCLINTEVFLAMEQPWIRLGELEKDNWSDDIGFFRRVREIGFQSYCDLDCQVGHMATVTIWPRLVDGKWHTSYDTHGTANVTIPASRGVLKEEDKYVPA